MRFRLLESTIRIRKRTLGPDHPMTLQSQHNLGGALFNADRIDDALKVSETVVKKATISLAPTSETRLEAETLLGRIYARLDRRQQAIDIFQRVSRSTRDLTQPNTTESLRPKYELASCLLQQGEYGQAIVLFGELVEDYRGRAGA